MDSRVRYDIVGTGDDWCSMLGPRQHLPPTARHRDDLSNL